MKPSPYAFAWFSGLASQRWMCPSTMKYFVPFFSYMEPPRTSVRLLPSGLTTTSQWRGSEGGRRKDTGEGGFPPAPARKRLFGQPVQVPCVADHVLPAKHGGEPPLPQEPGGNPILLGLAPTARAGCRRAVLRPRGGRPLTHAKLVRHVRQGEAAGLLPAEPGIIVASLACQLESRRWTTGDICQGECPEPTTGYRYGAERGFHARRSRRRFSAANLV